MKIQLSWVAVFAFLILSPFVYGMNRPRCSKMMNNGLYKTYKWQGVENRGPATTEEVKKNGSSKVQSDFSTENSTADLDPKYSSNLSSSMTQGTSSFGDCSVMALKERKEQRDLYIVQNYDQVRKQIAEGHGLHMETLAWMSLCDENVQSNFNSSLQNHYSEIYSSERALVGHSLDQIIDQTDLLKKNCFNLSSI